MLGQEDVTTDSIIQDCDMQIAMVKNLACFFQNDDKYLTTVLAIHV